MERKNNNQLMYPNGSFQQLVDSGILFEEIYLNGIHVTATEKVIRCSLLTMKSFLPHSNRILAAQC